MSLLEIIAAIFGAVAVYLSARENIWSWPTAIVNVGLYTIVFYQSRLYAEMGLQVIYLAFSIYGWYNWLHGGTQRTVLHVSRASLRTLALLAFVIAVGSFALGNTLATRTNAVLPYLDSTLAVTSLAAQWLMTRKVLENWLLWITVDVVYVPMFVSRGLLATAVLYAVFLVLAVLGFISWRRSYLASPSERRAAIRGLTRVVVTGSESTGKTQLAEELAAHYGVPWVPEFARDYAEQQDGALTIADVTPIARGQIAREDAAMGDLTGMIVLDTDLVSTMAYSEQYYGSVPSWIPVAAQERLADLYLVCDIDLPWVADTVRDAQHQRRHMHDAFIQHLTRFGATYHVVSGTGPERLSRAAVHIDAWRPLPLP